MPGKGNGKGGKKANNSRPPRRQRARRSNLAGVVQGGGNVPGHVICPRNPGGGNPRSGLNALHQRHLALPRSVGPYTVTRTTTQFASDARGVLVGAFRDFLDGQNRETWGTTVAIAPVNHNAAISATGNTRKNIMPGYSGLQEATIVPAAITLQLMNTEALQTTEGTVYVGRAHTQLDWGGSSQTWASKLDEFVSFARPTLITAADLAMRSVTIDAVPINMAALADFRPLEDEGGTTFTWGSTSKLHPQGFGPIVVYNTTGLKLQYLVTVEWRVRFGFGNVACGTHTQHSPATDHQWSQVLATMAAEGSGVKRGTAGQS